MILKPVRATFHRVWDQHPVLASLLVFGGLCLGAPVFLPLYVWFIWHELRHAPFAQQEDEPPVAQEAWEREQQHRDEEDVPAFERWRDTFAYWLQMYGSEMGTPTHLRAFREDELMKHLWSIYRRFQTYVPEDTHGNEIEKEGETHP